MHQPVTRTPPELATERIAWHSLAKSVNAGNVRRIAKHLVRRIFVNGCELNPPGATVDRVIRVAMKAATRGKGNDAEDYEN